MTDDQVSLGVATEITVVIIVAAMILLFAGIVVLIIIYVYIAARVLSVTVSSRSGVGTSNGVVEISTSSRMCKDDLENLPSFNYTKASSVAVDDDDCAVCLDNYKVGDKCRLLPVCNHKFHAHCVDLWLLSTPLCPICRTPTTPAATVTTSSVEESENQQLDNIVIELSGSAGLA